MSRRKSLVIALALVLSATAPVLGVANLFVVNNDETGISEAVWSTTNQDGVTAAILYSTLDGDSWAPSTTLSTIGRPGVTPVLLLSPEGVRTAVWGTAETTDRILLRTLPSNSGTWTSPLAVSDSAEVSRKPWAVLDNGNTYVSYEVIPSSGSRIVKVAKVDPGSNVERSLIASTASTSNLETRIYSEAGHLWLDWINSGTALGYCENVNGSWGAVHYKSYSGTSDITAARGRVRAVVLGE